MVAFCMAQASGVFAQDAGGFIQTFTISQRLENIDEDGFTGADASGLRSLTSLGYGISSETRTQRIALGLSSGLAFDLSGETDPTFEDSLATFDYARSSRNTALTFGVRYRRDDVDDLLFDETLVDDDIETGEGQREVLTVNSGLIFGQASRVTGTINHTFETSIFSDTLDPSLNDSDTQTADARLSFQISDVLTADVFATYSTVDEQGADATDRETLEIGTSASYTISPVTTLMAEVSYIEEESRGATDLQTDGFNYALSLTRLRPNGEISLGYTQVEALTGTRRQIRAGHELGFARGTLAYALGVSETDGFEPQLLANLAFSYQTDRISTVSITLGQEGTINGDDEEVVDTRLSLAYARDLTALSQVEVGFDMIDEDVLETDGTDQRTMRFDISFEYELGRDWGLVSGYEYSVVRRDGEDDRSRETVFIGLERSFGSRG